MRRQWSHASVVLIGAVVVLSMLVAAMATLVPVSSVGAASSVVWERYDVDMTVRSDGTVHVVERQLIQFDGRFSHGYATIPLANVDSIENVKVSLADGENERPKAARQMGRGLYDEDPGTYTAYATSTDMEIEYGFNPTSSFNAQQRLVVLEYDVVGGLRVYPDLDPANQQLWWIAIASAVTDIAPITEATVTITLPKNVGEQFTASPDLASNDGKTFTWTKRNLGSGDDFEVRLQFPPITSATVQPWQVRDDQVRKEREDAQQRSDIAGVFLFMAGTLLAVAGSIGLFGVWYTKGRDPQVGPVADFLAEPPDDLRPGAAGTLIDEVADQRDVIASIVDLGNRGVLKIEDQKKDALAATTTQFTLLKAPSEVEASERKLIESIFGLNAQAGQTVPLALIQSSFQTNATAIHDGYYQELVDKGYFTESPEKTRQRWSAMARFIPLVAIAVAIVISVLSGAATGWFVFPLVVGVILSIIASRLAKAMPRKTLAGAEAAAKWRAFKTYLGDLDKYTSVENAQTIFQQYLPYAIAFGLEDTWVNKFARVATPAPAWYEGGSRGGRPVVIIPNGGGSMWGGSGNRGGTWGGGNPSGGNGGGGDDGNSGGGGFPGWQDASDSAGRGMQHGSDSFLGMLQNVANALSENNNSGGWGSSGGWGGSSGSHRSSGGGGGFSGGGSSGGGGGGGSRGFG